MTVEYNFHSRDGKPKPKETPKEIDQARQDLDQRTFRQEFEGTFENYAGAVSLFVKDTSSISKYKKNITIYGNTDYKNKLL